MCVHEDDAITLKVAYVHTECNTLKQASAKSILNNLFVVTVFGPKRLRRTNWALLTVASYETGWQVLLWQSSMHIRLEHQPSTFLASQ